MDEVKTFFKSINAHISEAWLESCIQWCQSEVLGPRTTSKELRDKVYEQWLLSDLRDIEVSVLPPNLTQKEHSTLSGNFCLQMMKVIDISRPKLSQLQKLRKTHALTRENEEGEVQGKRVLQLTLTDGVQEIEAMEYKPIPSLSLNLHPGIKIKIMGPVTVRRGRLMLEPRHVKILGGEVEELLVVNAAENVLARALKLPENPNPGIIEEKLPIEEVAEKLQAPNRPNPREIAKKVAERPQAPSKPNPKKAPLKPSPKDEADISKDIDILLEAEMEHRKRSNTPDLFEDADFDVDDFQLQPPKRAPVTEDVFNDDDVFADIDIDAHLDKMDGPKVMTIAEIQNLKNEVGNFHIKAKFKSVVQKLTMDEDEYKLVIAVTDPTGELVVRIHSDLVSDFAGYTPIEISRFKARLTNRDEAATETVLKALERVKDRLLHLDHVLLLQVEKNNIPVVVRTL